MESVLDDGHVDVDDVALLESAVARYAVADDVVDRGADGLRIAAVAERRGDGVLHIDDVVVADPVQLLGRHPGDDVRTDHVERFGREPAGDPHRLLVGAVLDRHPSEAVLGAAHGFWMLHGGEMFGRHPAALASVWICGKLMV